MPAWYLGACDWLVGFEVVLCNCKIQCPSAICWVSFAANYKTPL